MTIVNRVAQSGIVTINLENFLPEAPIEFFDVKDYLFHGLILKEKDFRTALKELDWSQKYQDKYVAIGCTAEAIVPFWAYMLIGTYLDGLAKDFSFANTDMMKNLLIKQAMDKEIDLENLKDKRVVIKGCGEKKVPEFAYVEITKLLKPIVKSLMYGEPCSTVPIYKNKSNIVKTPN